MQKDKRKDMWKRWRHWLTPACYAVFLLGWLMLAFFHFAADHARTPVLLDASAAQTEQLEAKPDGTFLTTGVDGQLIFDTNDASVRLVRFSADFSKDPGEMELFYSRKEGQGFSVEKRVIGRPVEGGYLYTLPAGPLHALRLDTGTASENKVTIRAVELNPALPVSWYFTPTLRSFAAFIAVPALASCLIYTIIELYEAARARVKKGGKAGGIEAKRG